MSHHLHLSIFDVRNQKKIFDTDRLFALQNSFRGTNTCKLRTKYAKREPVFFFSNQNTCEFRIKCFKFMNMTRRSISFSQHTDRHSFLEKCIHL